MNWNLLVGPICVLAGMLVTLYVKSQAQEVAKVAVAEGIKAALATFKSELFEQLDEKYVRLGECTLKMDSHDDRLDVFELRANEFEKRFNTHFDSKRKPI